MDLRVAIPAVDRAAGRAVEPFSGLTLPRSGLLGLWKNGVDSIGESSITLAAGTADDLMAASWPFPDTTTTRQIDTLLGGDALFDSDGMAPLTRYGHEWASLDNVDYLYVGYNGIAGYSDSQAAKLGIITRVLLLPTMMIDTIEMLDNIRMVR